MTHKPNCTGRRGPSLTDRPRGLRLLRYAPLASAISAILAGVPVAHADTAAAQSGDTLEEVVVTAQKRTENLQNVPISINVFDTQKMEQLNIVDLDDYVKYSPSVSYVRSQGQGDNGQPGTAHIYMRGVVRRRRQRIRVATQCRLLSR